MKIYINNLNLDIINDLSELFKENLVRTEKYIELYTNDGIYRIEDKNTYYLDVIDKEIQILEKYYENFSIIVDPSFYHKKNTSSIHGDKHQSLQIMEKHYKFNKSSPISLVLKYYLDKSEYLANDIYIESQKEININDLFIKNEIIEFLSVLN